MNNTPYSQAQADQTLGRNRADFLIHEIAFNSECPNALLQGLLGDQNDDFKVGFITRIAALAVQTKIRPFVLSGSMSVPEWISKN